MNFWDTVAGHRLAEVLTRCLPQLEERLETLEDKMKVECKKEQVYFPTKKSAAQQAIVARIDAGLTFEHMIDTGSDEVLLIFSK